MTQQEAIQNVLASQEFLDVVEELKANHLQTIVYSTEKETNLREGAYHRISCINELMSTLESIAMTGEIKSKAWKIF
jgi:hypothetical protein